MRIISSLLTPFEFCGERIGDLLQRILPLSQRDTCCIVRSNRLAPEVQQQDLAIPLDEEFQEPFEKLGDSLCPDLEALQEESAHEMEIRSGITLPFFWPGESLPELPGMTVLAQSKLHICAKKRILLSVFRDFVMELRKGIFLEQITAQTELRFIYCKLLEDHKTIAFDQKNGRLINFPLEMCTSIEAYQLNVFFDESEDMKDRWAIVVEFPERKLAFSFENACKAQRFRLCMQLLSTQARQTSSGSLEDNTSLPHPVSYEALWNKNSEKHENFSYQPFLSSATMQPNLEGCEFNPMGNSTAYTYSNKLEKIVMNEAFFQRLPQDTKLKQAFSQNRSVLTKLAARTESLLFLTSDT